MKYKYSSAILALCLCAVMTGCGAVNQAAPIAEKTDAAVSATAAETGSTATTTTAVSQTEEAETALSAENDEQIVTNLEKLDMTKWQYNAECRTERIFSINWNETNLYRWALSNIFALMLAVPQL